eukprot:5177337-Prymnesium_polylepis.1
MAGAPAAKAAKAAEMGAVALVEAAARPPRRRHLGHDVHGKEAWHVGVPRADERGAKRSRRRHLPLATHPGQRREARRRVGAAVGVGERLGRAKVDVPHRVGANARDDRVRAHREVSVQFARCGLPVGASHEKVEPDASGRRQPRDPRAGRGVRGVLEQRGFEWVSRRDVRPEAVECSGVQTVRDQLHPPAAVGVAAAAAKGLRARRLEGARDGGVVGNILSALPAERERHERAPPRAVDVGQRRCCATSGARAQRHQVGDRLAFDQHLRVWAGVDVHQVLRVDAEADGRRPPAHAKAEV